MPTDFDNAVALLRLTETEAAQALLDRMLTWKEHVIRDMRREVQQVYASIVGPIAAEQSIPFDDEDEEESSDRTVVRAMRIADEIVFQMFTPTFRECSVCHCTEVDPCMVGPMPCAWCDGDICSRCFARARGIVSVR
jgi:hypothetical protein